MREPNNVDLSLRHDTRASRGTWSYYAALAIVLPVWGIPLLSWVTVIFEVWRNGTRLVRRNAHSLEKVAVLWALLEVSLGISSDLTLLTTH